MTCISLFKKEWKEVFLTLLKDLVKPIINTWNVMIAVKKANLLCNWMQIICMVGQWVNIYPIVDLNA